MCVAGEPLLHLDNKPERIDSERDDAKKHPQNIFAEELTAFAVEVKSASVNYRVVGVPSLNKA